MQEKIKFSFRDRSQVCQRTSNHISQLVSVRFPLRNVQSCFELHTFLTAQQLAHYPRPLTLKYNSTPTYHRKQKKSQVRLVRSTQTTSKCTDILYFKSHCHSSGEYQDYFDNSRVPTLSEKINIKGDKEKVS